MSNTRLFAYFLLTVSVLIFYGFILFGLKGLLYQTVFIAGLLLLLVGLSVEIKRFVRERLTIKLEFEYAIAVFLGSVTTFFISTFVGLGPVIAAGLVGFCYSVAEKRVSRSRLNLAAPVYCGAFVGMSSALVFDWWGVALAGIITGFVYVFSHSVYSGTGGTLGTIAFTGTIITKRIVLKLVSVVFGGV